jgi:hypothetical protein
VADVFIAEGEFQTQRPRLTTPCTGELGS